MRGSRVILILIFLLGLWLRWQLNGTWRLGPDEALYSTWARNIASGADPWLAQTPGVDKPPLLMYAIALAMNVYGYVEFASRFPSIIASAVSVLLTYLLARRLYKQGETALLAALLMALSPFAILYASTAYADSLMVMWLLLAAALAAHDHWAWTGVAAALAVLTKQEAPLLLPIVVMLGALSTELFTDARWSGAGSSAEARMRSIVRRLISLAVVFVVVAGSIEWLWEAQRPGQASPFGLGLAHYGGIGLVAVSEVWPRLVGWWDEALRWVFASPLLNGAMIVAVAALAWRAVRVIGERGAGSVAGEKGAGHDAQPTFGSRFDGANADLVLLAAIVYAVLAHTVVGFQMWNRYLLLAVPLLCLALARGADLAWQGIVRLLAARRIAIARPLQPLLPLLLAGALLAAPVGDALAGRIPVGSDHGAYWGIDETALYARENVPPGSVIYHDSLGWQLGYYLYGVHMDFWWYPSLDWLAQTAAGRAEQSQYVIVPSWEPSQQIAAALAAQGLVLLPVHSAHRPDGSISFQTYRIAPESGS